MMKHGSVSGAIGIDGRWSQKELGVETEENKREANSDEK
jgi:hypothetical protein